MIGAAYPSAHFEAIVPAVLLSVSLNTTPEDGVTSLHLIITVIF